VIYAVSLDLAETLCIMSQYSMTPTSNLAASFVQ